MKHGTRKEHRVLTAVMLIEQQRQVAAFCRDHRGKKGPLGTSWGADPWKENWISTPVHGYMLLSISSISVVQGLQEEVITRVRSVDIVGRNR